MSHDKSNGSKLTTKRYEEELHRLQVELIKLQAWIQQEGLRVAVIFEGRDAAGKSSAIKRITEKLNPRHYRVVALPKPSAVEQTQWYFQRYVKALPSAGELVFFDRSWYNRAGVERVMGFCSQDEYVEFLRACPQFERMLVRSGIILIKYWFTIDAKEQEKRFTRRIEDPLKRWKLGTIDFQSRPHFMDYTRARDDMFVHTNTSDAPWHVVSANSKKRARLNCITHLLGLIPYEDVLPDKVELPPLQMDPGYIEPPMAHAHLIPEPY